MPFTMQDVTPDEECHDAGDIPPIQGNIRYYRIDRYLLPLGL